MPPAISDLKHSTLPIETELDGHDLFQQISDNKLIGTTHQGCHEKTRRHQLDDNKLLLAP
jgi:hypothetical protein